MCETMVGYIQQSPDLGDQGRRRLVFGRDWLGEAGLGFTYTPVYPQFLSEDSGLGFGDGMPSARLGQVGDEDVREEAVYVGEDDVESIAAEDVQPVRTLKTP